MKTQILITCNNAIEANLIKGRLEVEGVQSFTTSENISNLIPMYNNMLGGGVQVMVFEEDLECAKRIIQDKLEPQSHKMICGNCSSENVELKGLNRNKLITALLSILVFVPFGNIRSEYYCKGCGWKLS